MVGHAGSREKSFNYKNVAGDRRSPVLKTCIGTNGSKSFLTFASANLPALAGCGARKDVGFWQHQPVSESEKSLQDKGLAATIQAIS